MSIESRTGTSTSRLKAAGEALVENYLRPGQVPGFLLEVCRRGERVLRYKAGMADIEHGRPIDNDSIFRIYSMTKPITAVALLLLVEDGLVDLDDEVARYIPAWKDIGVYDGGEAGAFRTRKPSQPMRLIHLATHTSGLTYEWMGASPVDAAYVQADFVRRDLPGGLEAFVATLGSFPLEFSPGEHWNYSLSMDVLAYIVERVSGVRFGEFLRRRIFEPLGMNDTGHHCPADKLGRLTACYVSTDGKLVRDESRTQKFATPAVLEEGGAGMLSTASDYLRFCLMLLGAGSLDGVRVLSPKSVALLGANLLPGGKTLGECFMPGRGTNYRMDGDGYSLCCGVTLDPARKHAPGSPGDFFWSGAAMTQFWVDPAEELAVVFMTQVIGSPHHFRFPRILRGLVYGALTN